MSCEKFAKIYFPAKAATQSGKAKGKKCLLVVEDGDYRAQDNMMNWVSSNFKKSRLSFSSIDRAVEYAKNNGIAFEVLPYNKALLAPKSYASNFVRNADWS